MSERYTKLFTLPPQAVREDLHTPVEVAAGVLLLDNQSGAALAQIKYKNISPKSIKNITVSISVQDSGGEIISGVNEFEYTGLVAAPGDFFGDKVPVLMTDNNAHAFSVDVLTVEFSDGTTWSKHGQEAANMAREVGAQAANVAKELGTQAAAAAKQTFKFVVKLPALIVNVLFSIITIGAEISAVMDFIATPSARSGVVVVFLGLASIVSLPGFGRLIFRKKYGIAQRILRWVIFAAIMALDFLIMAVVFN